MRDTKILKVFEQYIKKFDMNKGNVKAMYFHSIKMRELCKDIASNLGIFTDEEIIVCGLIGLFHDIGMFSNKFKNVLTLEDNTDRSKESIEILFESDKLLRQITDNNEYDNIIKYAIYCQNKNGLPKVTDEKLLHFCKVVKDAHVLENFRMVTNYPYMDMYIDNYPNDLVYKEFRKCRVISSKVSDNDADKILEVMSYVFGVYYSYSYSLLKEEDVVNKLVKALKISDKQIKGFILKIADVLNMFIDGKIGEENA